MQRAKYMTASVFGYRKPWLTLCWPFLYFLWTRKHSANRAPFLALKTVWGLNWLTTEFHFLAVFFWLWIPLICLELAGLPTGLRGPRSNTKSGAHNLWGHALGNFEILHALKHVLGASEASFMHSYSTYVPASCCLHLAVSEKYDVQGPS